MPSADVAPGSTITLVAGAAAAGAMTPVTATRPTAPKSPSHDRRIRPTLPNTALPNPSFCSPTVAVLATAWRLASMKTSPMSCSMVVSPGMKPLYKIYSEASIGKAHLRQMRLRTWREMDHDVPDWLIATIMERYYGGRTETRIRRVPMPGVHTDIRAEYPTVFVLQKLWPFLTAERINWTEEPPEVISGQLANLTVDALLDPRTWPNLTRLVLVEPDGDLLPTRSRRPGSAVANLAIAYRVGGPAQWFTYADVIASWLDTGRIPRIRRVVRFTAGSTQAGLRPIEIAGRSEFRVDPPPLTSSSAVSNCGKPSADQRHAAHTGRHGAGRGPGAQQQAAKIVATTIAYGAPIEINTTEHRRGQPVTVHRPDGTSYQSTSTRTEEPGGFFNPVIATLVAGAGRLCSR